MNTYRLNFEITAPEIATWHSCEVRALTECAAILKIKNSFQGKTIKIQSVKMIQGYEII